jgi:hypothetical protein
MDKMLGPGRERKQALLAVPEVVNRVRSLGASYLSAVDAETRYISEERRGMAVAIPGLSQAAEDALRRIETEIKKGAKLDVASGLLDAAIRREFIAVSQALDERFGRNAILRGEKDVAAKLSPSQRNVFEAMRERLQVLQRVVRAESSEAIIAERQRRAIDRARGLNR